MKYCISFLKTWVYTEIYPGEGQKKLHYFFLDLEEMQKPFFPKLNCFIKSQRKLASPISLQTPMPTGFAKNPTHDKQNGGNYINFI